MKRRSAKISATKMNEKNDGELKLENTKTLSKKEKTALKLIYKHSGKRFVYETLSRTCPEMAQKYLKFVSKNLYAVYIKWDEDQKKFVA